MFQRLSIRRLQIFAWNDFYFVILRNFFEKEWVRAVLRVFFIVEAQVCATLNSNLYFIIFHYNIPISKTKKISKYGMKLSKRWKVMEKIVRSTITSQSLWKSAFSPRFLVMKRSELYSFGTKHHKKWQLWQTRFFWAT